MVKRLLHLCVSIWLPYLELGWQARQDVSEETKPHQNIWGKHQNSTALYVLRERLMEVPTLCVLAQKPKTLIPAYIPNAHSHSQLQNVLRAGALLKCCWITSLPSHSRMKYPEQQLFTFRHEGETDPELTDTKFPLIT